MFKELVFLPGSQEKEITDFIEYFKSAAHNFKFHTSGSTGRPKEITFNKEQLIVSAKKSISYFKLTENQTFYLCLDIRTVAAKMLIIRANICGATLICGPVKREINLTKVEQIDFISLIPLQLHSLIERHLSKIKTTTILIGGSHVNGDLQKLITNNDLICYQSFGMTETLSHVALRKINNLNPPYEALDGIEFSTSDGCLVIDYPELQVSPIITNDEIELLDERHFYWKGRRDFVINSGGIKLHPTAIEEKIFSQTGIRTILFGYPDDKLGEKLVMLVLKRDKHHFNKSYFSFLNSYEVPKMYQCIKEFLYLPNDKIDRVSMQQMSKKNEWRPLL